MRSLQESRKSCGTVHRLLLIAAAVGALVAAPAHAEVPNVVTFSGVLFSDQECCGFSYSGPFTVRLYATAVGGAPLWEETYPDLAVDQGYFTLELGSIVPLPDDAWESEVWLEVELSGKGVLEPRMPVASVPFALRAGNADRVQGYAASDFATADHSHEGFVAAGQQGSVTAEMLAEGALAAEALVPPVPCTGGDVLRRSPENGAWVCGPDLNTTYLAGTGLKLGGINELSLDDLYVELLAAGICYDTPEELQSELDGRYAPLEHWHDQDYVNEGQKGSIGTDMLLDGSVTLEKLGDFCQVGQVLRKGPAGWECGEAAQGTTLSDLECKAGQLARFDGQSWGCVDPAPTPPKCDAPLAALQFDGTEYKCVNQQGLRADSWGYQWDDLERYATTWANAAAACKARGGRLPTITELFRVSAAGLGEIGTPYDSGYLWAMTQWQAGTNAIVRLTDGSITGEAPTNPRPYRCVFPNNQAAYFTGNHCYGPPGQECFAASDPGQRYVVDRQERPPVTYVAALDECNFYHASVMSELDYAELVAHAPGLGLGSNNWVWTSDSANYLGVSVVRWPGTDLNFAPTGNYVGFAQRDGGPYRFRCIGVSFPAGTHPNAVAGEFVAGETYLKGESTDRPAAKFAVAISTCFEAGGHLPLEREWAALIRAGLPGGTAGKWYWTSDSSRYDLTQVVAWTGVDLKFTDYHSQYSTWSDRVGTNSIPFRCSYYAIDPAYVGPKDNKCVVEAPCYRVEKGGDTKVVVWADPVNRAPLNYQAAVLSCYNLGGHLPSFRDLAELVRDGLPEGTDSWIWTADAVGDWGAFNTMIVKWKAADKAFDGTYSTYATWSDKAAATSRPYRCVWTNELR